MYETCTVVSHATVDRSPRAQAYMLRRSALYYSPLACCSCRAAGLLGAIATLRAALDDSLLVGGSVLLLHRPLVLQIYLRLRLLGDAEDRQVAPL